MKLCRMALVLMVGLFLGCSGYRPEIASYRGRMGKVSEPDIPRTIDTDALVQQRFFEVAKEASRDTLEVAFSDAPRVTVVPVGGKVRVRDIVRLIRKATGYHVIFPSSDYLDREMGDEVTCVNCRVAKVLRLLGDALGGLEPVVDEKKEEICYKDRLVVVYRLPLLGTRRDFKTSISTSEGSSSSGVGQKVGGSAPQSSVEVSSSFSDEFFSNLINSLSQFVGKRKVRVSASKAQGVITIDGNPRDVREVCQYLETLLDDLRYQIEFTVSILQVELYDQYRSGIDWNKVFQFLPRSLIFKGNWGMATGVGQVTLQLVSSRSTNQMIYQFLKQYGRVHVVSRPVFYLQNGFSAFFSSGTEVPYVQTVERQRYGDLNEETVTPTMAVAHSGLFFTIKAKITDYDSGAILVSFMPEIATIVSWKDFKFEGTEFQNPVIEKQNFTTRAIVFSGNTLLIGGIRVYSYRRNRVGTGIRLLDSAVGKKENDEKYVELVVLITPRIVRGRYYVSKKYL